MLPAKSILAISKGLEKELIDTRGELPGLRELQVKLMATGVVDTQMQNMAVHGYQLRSILIGSIIWGYEMGRRCAAVESLESMLGMEKEQES